MSSHPERAHLLDAIAAQPDDDALRWSLADCLEREGEPERAAFIRAQLVPSAAIATPPDQSRSARAAAAFEAAGRRWYEPLLFDLGVDPAQVQALPHSPSWRAVAEGHVTLHFSPQPGAPPPSVSEITFQRGLGSSLSLRLPTCDRRCSLAQALRREPLTILRLSLGLDVQVDATAYAERSDPALRQVRNLDLSLTCREDGEDDTVAAPDPTSPVLAALLADANLDGVRDLFLGAWPPRGGLCPLRLPPSLLADLGRARLATHLEEVMLADVDAAGVAALCQARLPPWQNLTLSGAVGAKSVRHLHAAGLGASLQSLRIDLETDADIAELAGLPWDRLRVLAIDCPRIGDTALRALAAARFTPHLSRLLLSGRPATPTIKDSSAGLHALRSALSSSELAWPSLS